jgi:hypothetical protein
MSDFIYIPYEGNITGHYINIAFVSDARVFKDSVLIRMSNGCSVSIDLKESELLIAELQKRSR